MAKQGILRSALAGATGLWRKRTRSSDFSAVEHADPEQGGEALFRRGRARMRVGDVEAALADFDRAIELLPDFADALVSRAECLDMIGRVEQARPDYERARRLWSEMPAGAPDRRYLFRRRGHFA